MSACDDESGPIDLRGAQAAEEIVGWAGAAHLDEAAE